MAEDKSTLKSVYDSTIGAAQSALGSMTGNKADEAHGDARRAQGHEEYAASHDSTAKLGPLNVSSSGATTADHSDRTEGSWNQTVGSGKEMLGNVLGSEQLRQDGMRQNQEGKGQEAHGQMSDFGHGATDRMKGRLGEAASGLTGDRERQAHYQQLHDEGKTKQRSAEEDIQRQSDY